VAARRTPVSRVRELLADRPGAGEPPVSPYAALLALFEECGDARVVLIRRAIALPTHPGEVALPGGRVEPGESMVDAALREASEEVGLAPEHVEVVGWLDRVVGATSGSVATPVVGVLGSRPRLVAAPGEVEAVFDVALSDLMAVYREERWDVPAPDQAMHFFELPEDTVWGMTARILHQLLADLTERKLTLGSPPGMGE
jgi:8-oxo-dGTP pyrophosphatase MutT (NUDIX family)